MDWILVVTQLLNGLQLGVLLFLLAAGLTLVHEVHVAQEPEHGVRHGVDEVLGTELRHRPRGERVDGVREDGRRRRANPREREPHRAIDGHVLAQAIITGTYSLNPDVPA